MSRFLTSRFLPVSPGFSVSPYTFKAEFVRGHNTVTVTRTVTLRAGQSKLLHLGVPAKTIRYPRPEFSQHSSIIHPSSSVYPGYRFRDMRQDEDSVRD